MKCIKKYKELISYAQQREAISGCLIDNVTLVTA